MVSLGVDAECTSVEISSDTADSAANWASASFFFKPSWCLAALSLCSCFRLSLIFRFRFLLVPWTGRALLLLSTGTKLVWREDVTFDATVADDSGGLDCWTIGATCVVSR